MYLFTKTSCGFSPHFKLTSQK